MLGYADGVASLADRLPRLARAFTVILLLLPCATAVAVSTPHRRWQEPGAAALSAASNKIANLGGGPLGLTFEAAKTGLLFRGQTTMVGKDASQAPAVVLCSTRDPSYRASVRVARCDLPGYEDQQTFDDFHVMVRRISP
jgi:hypothetical protein